MVRAWYLSAILAAVSTTAAAADTAKILHAAVKDGRATVEVDVAGLGDAASLVLERFRVTTPTTRFVVGAAQTPLAFDPESVRLYRGHVAGAPHRRVFVAQRGDDIIGQVDGPDGPRWIGRSAAVTPLSPGAAPPTLCHVEPTATPRARRVAVPTGVGATPPTVRVIDVAIETDFEYTELFDDPDAAAAYVVMLYGVMSEHWVRDVGARLELTFVRVWDVEDELFNAPSPLGEFRDFWQANMGGVDRDVAQMMSGRRDYPYGGAAFVDALCGNAAYSVTGYINGQQPGHLDPSIFQYDLLVTSHELGHNGGEFHTHNYGLDTCNDLMTTPQRGTIMSYCSQTVSGGNANTDMRFHTMVQGFMREAIEASECVITDCNGNGTDDLSDIQIGGSADANGNGMPDECEDCNENGTLDTVEITNGTSLDLNNNAVPDECEADCNGNGVPDDRDIALGTSSDAWGNGIPDECEDDCDDNGTSDYTQIQDDLTLDIDRNTHLDTCEDCDGDGTIDLEALGGAHFVWIACLGEQSIREAHSRSGVVSQISDPNGVAGASDLVITTDGRIFVSTTTGNQVIEYDRTGAVVGTFVPSGLGGLVTPTGLVIGPNGNLFVSSEDTSSVLEFDGVTGSFVQTFVTGGAGGLTAPFGLAFGPSGNLFVTMGDGGVAEYAGATGAFVGHFVDPDGGDTGGLTEPRGMIFKPDGNLLVVSHATNNVLEYDGETGAFAGQFNRGGTDEALTLDGPWGIRLGPDGQVYVGRHHVYEEGGGGGGILPEDYEELHVNATRLYVFDTETGNFMRSYVTGHDTGLVGPTGFDFYPDLEGVDCNVNGLVDTCEIAQGLVTDANGNGVPDACDCTTDLDASGATDFADLLFVLSSWGPCVACVADLDGNNVVDFSDLLLILSSWGPCPGG